MFLATILSTPPAFADIKDQAKRVYDRIAGVPPSETELNSMVNDLGGSPSEQDFIAAAIKYPMSNKYFYNATLKNWITPWTNEQQTVFAPLNDFSATAIGLIADQNLGPNGAPDGNHLNFREILSANIIYVANAAEGLPTYSNSNNVHYEELENSGAALNEVLERRVQSSITGLPESAVAGVMTTRAAAHAFFVAGTNRAMLRFTLMNFLCNDLEQFKDNSRPTDRIRQDVVRSPGGDSRIYLNSCSGCHSGMDPLAQAFAYYEWTGEEGTDEGEIAYTPDSVQAKNLINSGNFKWGYQTPDDTWINYWRKGPNALWVGWPELAGSGYVDSEADQPYATGQGASSLGAELAGTRLFAQCQSRQVFKNVCLREPGNDADHAVIDSMVADFDANDGSIKRLFGKAAYYCRGE
ncbi:MAG: hypothetical protein CSA49_06975 [Gammaproteobacteria bacterium]|nr:MAG: hypothetical protein CSA49_06975 [Gammaproteobacteria bacterium]